MNRSVACSVAVIGLLLFAGCGGGPPMDRKDMVKSVKLVVRYEPGIVDTLDLPDEFKPLETAGKPVTYRISDRGTCKRLRDRLSTIKPERSGPTMRGQLVGDVTIHTGWGKTIELTWYGSHFEMADGRSFDSSRLSVLLAGHIRESITSTPTTRP